MTANVWAEPVLHDSFRMLSNCTTPTPYSRTRRQSTCACEVKSSINLPSKWTYS